VLRHHHHPDTVADRVDKIMVAVFLTGDRERAQRLAEHVTVDFVYVSPDAVYDGVGGLGDAFSHYRQDVHPSALQRTTDVDIHHAYFRYAWRRTREGQTTMEGWSFGMLNEEGKITRVVSFNGLSPGSAR
jgi:hypothetical protein